MNKDAVIPMDPLKVMLAKETDFANLLRYGLEHFQNSLDNGLHELRLEGFKGHAMWFASTETPMDVLGLLWRSSYPIHRVEVIRVLREVINNLPPWSVNQANDDSLSPPMALAATLIAFVRVHGAIELVTALRVKAFAECWWMKNPRLAPNLLLTMFSLDYSLDVNEFLGQVIDHEALLLDMSYEQFSMFCLAYLAGLSNVDGKLDADGKARLKSRLKSLHKAADQASCRPEAVLKELNGRMKDLRDGLSEALNGAGLLPTDMKNIARGIAETLVVDTTEEVNNEIVKTLDEISEKSKAKA